MLRQLSPERLFLMLVFTGSLATPICVAQTGGSLSGTVLDDTGKPVAASVTISRKTMPPSNARAQAGTDGAFSIANLPAGGYTVCVQVKGGGYLDPCTWSSDAPSVQIAAGQAVKGFRVVTRKGAIVKVRVNDSEHMLGAAPGPNSSAPHVLIGVWTRHRTFEPAVLIGKDANGSDHQATIPPGEPGVLHITGHGVALTDAAGAALNAAGAGIAVSQTATAPSAVVTINVHSPGKP